MEGFRTKRGTITFSTSQLMLEESLSDYFTNAFEGFWEEGGLNEKLFFLFMVAAMSFSASFIGAAFITAPLDIQMNAAGFIILTAFAVMIYEHWNKVDKDKFIKYDDIKSVKLVEGMKPFTCPRFIIKFEKNDNERTRYVTMPVEYMPSVERDVAEIKKRFKDKNIDVEA